MLEEPLVDIVWRGEPALSLIEPIFKIAYVLLRWLFDVELTSLTAIIELSFILDLIVVGQLHSQAMFKPIQKLPVVDSAIIEIKKAFVGLVLGYGVAIVDAIFELFDAGRADDDITAETEIGEEGKYLGWL